MKEEKNQKNFIEVKNVTLSRKKQLAEFPDAVTSRGLKHINELVKAGKKNYKIFGQKIPMLTINGKNSSSVVKVKVKLNEIQDEK